MEEVSLHQPNNSRPTEIRKTVIMDEIKTFLKNIKHAGILVLSLVALIIGIILLAVCKQSGGGSSVAVDYANCMGFDKTQTCAEVLDYDPTEECVCYINMTIEQPLDTSSNIVLYYQLDNFMQINKNYQDSRDPKQLLGWLGKPSEACKPYDYVNTTEGIKPIAPCGAVADAMFNDTFQLAFRNKSAGGYFQLIYTGLVSAASKALYHNPPGDLKQAFKNFSKPKNWAKEIWQLDEENAENNGFQNERFIAWMDTSLQRKPAWRINTTGQFKDGLPAGVYSLKIQYNYPPSRYNGPRRVIISNHYYYASTNLQAAGIILILIGLAALALVIILFLRRPQK